MMFCSNCGKTNADNLNYCSGCGAPTEKTGFVPDRRMAQLFAISGTFIVIFGLIVFYPLLRTLLNSPIDTSAKVVLILSYLVTVLLMFSAMMGMAWKQNNSASLGKKKKLQQDEYHAPASFRDVNTSQLPAGDPGFGSVTDSTTRTLDEVAVKRSRSN